MKCQVRKCNRKARRLENVELPDSASRILEGLSGYKKSEYLALCYTHAVFEQSLPLGAVEIKEEINV